MLSLWTHQWIRVLNLPVQEELYFNPWIYKRLVGELPHCESS